MNPIEKRFSIDTVLSASVLGTGIAWFFLAAASAPLTVPNPAAQSAATMVATHAGVPVELSATPAHAAAGSAAS